MSDLSTTNPCALLTVRDVATWLQVHPKTVYGWASRQAIPALKVQGALRFRREDLLSLEGGRDPPGGCILAAEMPPSQPSRRASRGGARETASEPVTRANDDCMN